MTVVTGVSGSGKSSLVKGILYPTLKRHLDEVCDAPGEFKALEGDWKDIHHVEMVDQNPIGKSTRSNPATYIKAYDYCKVDSLTFTTRERVARTVESEIAQTNIEKESETRIDFCKQSL